MGTCIQQGDVFYSAGLHRSRCQPKPTQEKIGRGEVLDKMQASRTGRKHRARAADKAQTTCCYQLLARYMQRVLLGDEAVSAANNTEFPCLPPPFTPSNPPPPPPSGPRHPYYTILARSKEPLTALTCLYTYSSVCGTKLKP